MSMKSLQIKLNSQTSNDDNRGGEKKVMKKSLSVLVATAMVSSIFASVAFAADLTTQQKLDELIKLGIFDKDGTGNGSELTANMSREQLAKILAKLKDLKEVTGTSYTDVAADRWSAGFIQAVSKATPPLMDGVATGLFDPAGNVTLEQLAAVAVRALGLQQNTTATVKGNVSDWAKGYVAAAIANGLLSEKADYTKPAIRSELVEASYSAQQAIANSVKPAKASVKSVKAAGVQKVEVTLDRDVDTTKATLTLKKGATDIATTVKWSDDKKSATLTLKDAKINQGDYTVTLGGLAATDIATATGSFTAENEQVKKIEFASAIDTIAKTKKAKVQFKAVNQYGENASLSSTNFTVTTPSFSSSTSKDGNGNFVITIDTTTTTDGGAVYPGQTIIPIYIYENDSRVSIQQNFKLGSEPFVQKMELGTVTYTGGKKSISNTGDSATIPVVLYDQYGNPVGYDSKDADKWVANAFTTPYSEKVKWEFGDFDNDNFGEVKLTLNGRVEKTEDFTVNVQIEGANATAKISVASAKLATKIVFGEPTGSLYAGDDSDVYLPIYAYDAEGNQLTVDDIVDSQNLERIKVSASGVKGIGGAEISTDKPSIEKSGNYKGQIHITQVTGSANSYAYVYAYLNSYTGNNSYITKNLPIAKARVLESIKVVTEPAKKTIGGTTNYKVELRDQNGTRIDRLNTVDSVSYTVYAEVTGTDGLEIQQKDHLGTVIRTFDNGDKATFAGDRLFELNNVFTFKVKDAYKYYNGDGKDLTLKLTLRKTDASGTRDISTLSKSVTWADLNKEQLTYTVSQPTDGYAAADPDNILTGNSGDAKKDPTNGSAIMRKTISVTAKDSAGNTVVLPNEMVNSVNASVYSVASTGINYATVPGSSPLVTLDVGAGRVIGYKPGTTNLNVAYKELTTQNVGTATSPDYRLVLGDTKLKSVTFNVKGDAPVITAVSGNTRYEGPGKAGSATAVVDGELYGYGAAYTNAYQFMNLSFTDSYGIGYSTTNILAYRNVTNVFYELENVSLAGGRTLSVDAASGVLTTGGVAYAPQDGDSFTIRATSASGKSLSTYVKIKAPTTIVK